MVVYHTSPDVGPRTLFWNNEIAVLVLQPDIRDTASVRCKIMLNKNEQKTVISGVMPFHAEGQFTPSKINVYGPQMN